MKEKNITAYFEASLAGKKKYLPLYRLIVKELRDLGCQVEQTILDASWEEKESISKEKAAGVYKRILKSISKADVFIGDMTFGSPGVAMEVQDAIYRFKKPTLILYHRSKKGGKPGAPFYGNPSQLLFLEYYSDADLKSVLEKFLNKAKKKIASERFTVRMTEELDEYIEYLKILWKESSKNDVVIKLIKKERTADENYKKFLESRAEHI